MQIEKVYEPQRFEPHWAQWWIDAGVFHAEVNNPGRVFSLVIPPPNVTGSLHIGHMLEHTEIDVTVRWHRMIGDNTLWLPGTDHAGIATQMVVDRALTAEGINRHDLGREKFVERVWEWKARYGDTIKRQMIRTGTSCDWARERFTLDPGLSQAVREVFVRLYEKGLVYRGEYMVNWCPHCRTAISDLETAHQETPGNLWHIRYPVKGTDRHLVVATTRPETMLGDTAVAINAKDARYFDLHGKTVGAAPHGSRDPHHPGRSGRPRNSAPASSRSRRPMTPTISKPASRHNLPKIRVIDELAQMTEAAGKYAGLDRFEARKRVVQDLERARPAGQDRALPAQPGHAASAARQPSSRWSPRSGSCKHQAAGRRGHQGGRNRPHPVRARKLVENLLTSGCTTSATGASRASSGGAIAFPPGIARRVPRDRGGARERRPPARAAAPRRWSRIPTCSTPGSAPALWPFSTLGWPDQTADLAKYYPTSLLITGFDILFFWVARMVMLGCEFMGDVPFRQVYIHGLVRDAEAAEDVEDARQHVIDPLVVTEKYGTDAVRMALLQRRGSGHRYCAHRRAHGKLPRLRQQDLERRPLPVPQYGALGRGAVGARRPGCLLAPGPRPDVPIEDRWIFSRLNACAEQANRAIDQYRYHEAAQVLWKFFWHEFCDWYVELKKLRFREGSGLDDHWRNALAAFETALRLLHPVMPFLTEELWQRLARPNPNRPVSIALAGYPQYHAEAADEAAEREIAILQDVITLSRNLRADMKIDPKLPLEGTLYAHAGALEINTEAIQRLANVKLTSKAGAAPANAGAMRSTPEFDLVLDVPKTQVEAQRKRLVKENEQLEKNIANSKRQLGDETFLVAVRRRTWWKASGKSWPNMRRSSPR